MTFAQIVLAALTLLASLASAALAYWIGLANAMATVPRKLSMPQLGAIAAPWLVAAALLWWQALHSERVTTMLLSNAPAAVVLILLLGLGAGATMFDSPRARERRRQRHFEAEQAAMQRLWEQHGHRERWQLRVDRGLAGLYLDARQVQRAGVEWVVTLHADDQPYTVIARSFTARASTDPGTEADLAAHARMALDTLDAKLSSGWRPQAIGDEVVFVDA